ncbi:hypothetical protein [Actinoplanes sp. URMC 104]|uniref:hypothetical protein n=1 Tax=Actinoplanes sp. URMC 104 TaxID=3423409 RepID=UPI003F197DCE
MRLRTQLTLAVTVLVALVVALTGFVLVVRNDHRDRADLDRVLATRADQVRAAATRNGSLPTDGTYAIRLINGGELLKQVGSSAGFPTPAKDGYSTVSSGDDEWRSLAQTLVTGAQLQILVSLDDLEEQHTDNVLIVDLLVLLAAVLSAAGVWFATGLVLRPFQRLLSAARDLDPASERLPEVKSPREVAELTAAVNDLLDRAAPSLRPDPTAAPGVPGAASSSPGASASSAGGARKPAHAAPEPDDFTSERDSAGSDPGPDVPVGVAGPTVEMRTLEPSSSSAAAQQAEPEPASTRRSARRRAPAAASPEPTSAPGAPTPADALTSLDPAAATASDPSTSLGPAAAPAAGAAASTGPAAAPAAGAAAPAGSVAAPAAGAAASTGPAAGPAGSVAGPAGPAAGFATDPAIPPAAAGSAAEPQQAPAAAYAVPTPDTASAAPDPAVDLRPSLADLGVQLDQLLDNPDMPATQRHLLLALMADEHRRMVALLDGDA